ncbi:inorganic phosphate transporter [Blochmannia endosymbiont of Polyrhachis (Hedomyrma) turneri]|uniref:inorganic phosphate transporter n=1 Tax=Blochmannia endosymbiont of Polyrhachis (Hedomyrma) turneri TaxID=1505596 RepID=UPI00061A793A|nr:inorganic phosphate transporter [Blochmannia endosymbiont of Polyrhachis (Hedomyrma) turneri]AKC59621.1 Low-affinity inorganic phosphate transporter 1 [Blochmannia endosymbiont of Polyrhachis (Hedomyrma) turneri]
MIHLFADLELHIRIMLICTLVLIFIYEAINGFHDTSNSVVTVIYTCALQSRPAVAISGIFNFLGVTFSGLSVAYTIIHLLPMQLIINNNPHHILAMVFSILFAAILWNLSTWYLRLPTSSSHTLIGALIGIGIINTITTHCQFAQGLNIQKLIEILLSLIISPLIGLFFAKIIMLILCQYWKNDKQTCYIHMTPSEKEQKNGKRQPPVLLRSILIVSSAGVSFSHGANDGQKGIGLIMLLLIGVIPTSFIINMNTTQYEIEHTRAAINYLHQYYINTYSQQNIHQLNKIYQKQGLILKQQKFIQDSQITLSNKQIQTTKNNTISYKQTNNTHQIPNIKTKHDTLTLYDNDLISNLNIINHTLLLLKDLHTYDQLNPHERSQLRYLLLCILEIIDAISKSPNVSSIEKYQFTKLKQHLLHTIEYAPLWIIITVAISLSLGTIIGWKRVATTIGEKIGKKDMTYAQGLATQVTTAIAIGIASYAGMPVSTTHVLSSSMAGSMLMSGHGIQNKIVKNILINWILTLPISIILSSLLYWIILKFFLQ